MNSNKWTTCLRPHPIVTGDIHYCSLALAAPPSKIALYRDDTIVGLGDYADYGINNNGVLEQFVERECRCRLVPLLPTRRHSLLLIMLQSGGTHTRRPSASASNEYSAPNAPMSFENASCRPGTRRHNSSEAHLTSYVG